ncbi:phosphatidylinositol-specific phospholipase C [Xylariaceae sp. FL1272]|nr:phosphatidylinositol-specific phospholipase C [Xylariaceae sp. FL1272]
MSSTSNPTRPSPEARPSPGTPALTSAANQASIQRVLRPNHVQTTHQPNTQPTTVPVSAISASTRTSSSHQNSPLTSPVNSAMTTSSSIQASPDPFRDHDVEMFPPPPPLHLGEPLLAHRLSMNSMAANTFGDSEPPLSSRPSMNSITPSTAGESSSISASGNSLIRRFSNRAGKFARARRQSSATPNSRDVSLGPGILRRRSDSTNATPAESVLTDSDEEVRDEILESFLGSRSRASRTSSSGAPSTAGSSWHDIRSGPILPVAVIKGTMLSKISKKKYKPMLFTLEQSAGKIVWNSKRSSKCIYVDDIKEVRLGSDIRQYRIDAGIPESEEGRFFSILYVAPEKSKNKVMHLVAGDEETFGHWISALESICKDRELHMRSLMAFNENAVRRFWTSKMAKQFDHKIRSIDDETIDFQGVEQICRNMHIHMSQKVVREKFEKAGGNDSKGLNLTQFLVFVRLMKRRKEVETLYEKIESKRGQGITLPDFIRFLRKTQGEDVDDKIGLWASRFNGYAHQHSSSTPSRSNSGQRTMSVDDLVAFLVSKDNDHLIDEPTSYVLDRPITEYFISSSHNTYLIGWQIHDVSSVEGYIIALERGCRSVEIDCWDGSDGQPVVKHGRSLTNAISFREVINTVNKYAFVASRFPLWISLEVHCNAAQQEIMAETMKEIFGSRLITEPLDPAADKLPSPSDLIDRILIKVKGTHLAREQRKGTEAGGRRRGNSLTSPFSRPVVSDNSVIPPQPLGSSPLIGPSQQSRRVISKRVDTITEGEVHEAISSSTSDCDTEEEASEQRKTSKIVKNLGDLGVYCSGVKWQGFDSAACKTTNHILSFMEGTFKRHLKNRTSKRALERHNMRYLMRVYPEYRRFTSSNFIPVTCWRRGVQMAALNWQTFDTGMQLNQAMFAGGQDKSGYVLKPEAMRSIRRVEVTSEEALGKLRHQNLSFKINVISAQQLMRPANISSSQPLNPYVEIEIFHANDKRDKHDSMAGIPIETDTPLKVQTCVVKENGFNPIFNHTGDMNVTTKHPELVFIRFAVKFATGDTPSSSKPVATYTVKLSSLKQGYRTLPLLDSNGDEFLFSRLFCYIEVNPATSVYLPNPEAGSDSSVGKLKHIGRNVFSRTSSVKSSFEKTSMESGNGEV